MKLILTLGGLTALCLAGCAVGRGPLGEVVLGFEAGQLAETSEQILATAAGQIPVVGGQIQAAILAASGGGATVGGVGKLLMDRLEKRRRESDIAREKAEQEAAVLRAKLEAANGGSA